MSVPLFFRDTRAAYVAALVESKAFAPHVVVGTFFDQGEPNFLVPGLHTDVTSRHVVYVADWSTPAARYYDMCVLVPLAEMQPTLLTIVIPFDPAATMERETAPGVVVTANVNAKMLSALPCAKRVLTIDLHTMANQFYFHNAAVRLASMMPYALKYIRTMHPQLTAVCFPDEGAKKRFGQFFLNERTIVCAKERGAGDERRVRIVEGADVFHDKPSIEILIVDDLTRTGGTLAECARVLRSAGATRVHAYVTHALLTPARQADFGAETGKYSGLIDRFYASDTTLGFDDDASLLLSGVPSGQLLLDELATEMRAARS